MNELSLRAECEGAYLLSVYFPVYFSIEGGKQITYGYLAQGLCPQRQVGIYPILYPPALPFFNDIAGAGQVGNNLADCPFRNVHGFRQFDGSYPGMFSDKVKSHGMFGYKGPLRHFKLPAILFM
jgi:hypothetical protein